MRAAIHSSRDTTLCSRARLFGSDVIVPVVIFSFLAPSAKAEASTVTTKERAPSGHLVDDPENPWRVFGSGSNDVTLDRARKSKPPLVVQRRTTVKPTIVSLGMSHRTFRRR